MKHLNKLILGSQSPRRQELLTQAGFEFEIMRADFDESYSDDMPVEDVASYLAQEKNRLLRVNETNATIITADTVVISEGQILGKPLNRDEANQMLSSLSGKVHDVITGVCISNKEKSESFSSKTSVNVKQLSSHEVNYYLDQFKPYDKAGAYGIQEWFGLIAIESIEGSYYNVVGLPIDRLYDTLLNKFGFSVT